MPQLNYDQLKTILPHAYPFLLIDKVEDYKENEYLIATKNITGNEWMAEGQSFVGHHFPETLLIESAAQAALVLYHVTKVKMTAIKPKYFLGKARARFKKIVHYGEILRTNVFSRKMLDSGGYADVHILGNGILKAKFELIFKVQR